MGKFALKAQIEDDLFCDVFDRGKFRYLNSLSAKIAIIQKAVD